MPTKKVQISGKRKKRELNKQENYSVTFVLSEAASILCFKNKKKYLLFSKCLHNPSNQNYRHSHHLYYQYHQLYLNDEEKGYC